MYDVHVDQTTMLYFGILTLKISLICSKILILAFFNRLEALYEILNGILRVFFVIKIKISIKKKKEEGGKKEEAGDDQQVIIFTGP